MTEEPSTQNGPIISGEFVSHSAQETFDLAERTGAQLKARTVLLLSGDLGAGKTVFAKGLAAGLGIDPTEVTSPSFTLVNEYAGRLRLYHIDLYRLDTGACRELGLEEIFADEQAVTVIEWAERLEEVPAGATRVEIEYLSDDERRIRITPAT
ncbi:MAG TPA: tRNA (adenosine(37)-N6)-threonylcarbamoyltransferase complex ATPase subunit type 1 TsaE [Blastocatellia bacterium]|nr:tRNA (adenosine(37)-N6)-threonylcarbamoyltransferase complex ATPase subunit type 1 TsaE [Blastocatellia bacterium]